MHILWNETFNSEQQGYIVGWVLKGDKSHIEYSKDDWIIPCCIMDSKIKVLLQHLIFYFFSFLNLKILLAPPPMVLFQYQKIIIHLMPYLYRLSDIGMATVVLYCTH